MWAILVDRCAVYRDIDDIVMDLPNLHVVIHILNNLDFMVEFQKIKSFILLLIVD